MKFKVLVIDDNPSIHDDYEKVLGKKNISSDQLQSLERALFSQIASKKIPTPDFLLSFAHSGQEAVNMIKKSVDENDPFTLAFVDIRMPPGMDGIETIKKIYAIDPQIETVICSAYTDYSLEEIIYEVKQFDKLLFLKKPFTPVEIKQVANCLCAKWLAEKNKRNHILNLESIAQAKNQFFNILIESAIEINQTVDMEEAFINMIKKVCNHTTFSGGHVYLSNDKGNLYSTKIWYFHNISNTYELVEATNLIKNVYPAEDIPGHVLVDKEPICYFVDHPNNSLKRREELQHAQIKTVLGLPVLLGRRVMGIIELYSQVEEKISRNLLQVLKETANLLSRPIERSLNEIELKDSREKALTAVKAKSEFLANMSHEIRTPLNAILGYTQLLRSNEDLANTTKSNYLKIIERSGNHLLNIINTILDLSKMESGKFSLKVKPFNLKALINEIKAMFQVKCDQKGISLHLDISDTIPPNLNGDVAKLRQILINIINNAVKHTTKGSVSVTCMYSKEMVFFDISDTGSGMAQEHLANIFKPFYQVESLEEREGTGLGLAIVKKDLEIMNGSISVGSTIGKGTTFKVEVPLLRSNDTHDENTEIPYILGLQEGQNWKILLIDNDIVGRELLFDVFQMNGFLVEKSNFHNDLINDVNRINPNIIFFDINHTLITGSAVIQKIKSNFPDIVLIGITTDAVDRARHQADILGCQDILLKPFEINEALFMLGKHLPIEYKTEEKKKRDSDTVKKLVIDLKELGKIIQPNQLETLWECFSNGDLNGLDLEMESLATENPMLSELAKQFKIWVNNFNDNEIGQCLEALEKSKEN